MDTNKLTKDIHARWRDLLFYIKKGANWSFPLGVEGIKSDFIRFVCDTLYYMNSRREKKQASQIKRTFTFLQIKNKKTIKRRNVGPSFLKPLTNSFKYIFEVTFIFQHNNIYLQI